MDTFDLLSSIPIQLLRTCESLRLIVEDRVQEDEKRGEREGVEKTGSPYKLYIPPTFENVHFRHLDGVSIKDTYR